PLPEPPRSRPIQPASRSKARDIAPSVHQLLRVRVGGVAKGFTFVEAPGGRNFLRWIKVAITEFESVALA
ncbi:MAG: hypothetical protein V3V08_14405, partial [Nannocystaceae bacterium]